MRGDGQGEERPGQEFCREMRRRCAGGDLLTVEEAVVKLGCDEREAGVVAWLSMGKSSLETWGHEDLQGWRYARPWEIGH